MANGIMAEMIMSCDSKHVDLDKLIRDLSEESIVPLIITILFKHNIDMASGFPSYDRKMKMKMKRFSPSITLEGSFN